jgi:hypothetical protein
MLSFWLEGTSATVDQNLAPQQVSLQIPAEATAEAKKRRERVAERGKRTHIICHRRASEFAHENTLEAYRATFELGAAPDALAFIVLEPSDSIFPLKKAESSRFLIDRNGKPFLIVGDSAWSLIVQLGEKEIDHYLEDRARRGFNSVIVNLIEHKFCTDPPRTRARIAPFLNPGDFSAPNPAYFDFAHQVLKKANDRGIAVWLFPAYLGSGGGDEGWFREMKASGKANLRAYGRFVAKRFRDLPNIVWVVGGDFTPAKADQWTITEVAEGIREEDTTHLMTAHGAPAENSAVADFGEQEWLTVNAVYSYEKTLFRPLLAAYHRQPIRPFVLLESVYEGEHDSKPEEIRRQAYWTILSGGCGQFFGNNPIWHFDGPGLYPSKTIWQKALDGTGSRDIATLRQLFVDLPWHELIPEENHLIVHKGYGKDLSTILTARTSDKRLAIIYVSSTGARSQALTVDLRQFSGPVSARWYNPTAGRFTAIGDRPFPNLATHSFQTPGDNGTKTNDWLLILKAN